MKGTEDFKLGIAEYKPNTLTIWPHYLLLFYYTINAIL